MPADSRGGCVYRLDSFAAVPGRALLGDIDTVENRVVLCLHSLQAHRPWTIPRVPGFLHLCSWALSDPELDGELKAVKLSSPLLSHLAASGLWRFALESVASGSQQRPDQGCEQDRRANHQQHANTVAHNGAEHSKLHLLQIR